MWRRLAARGTLCAMLSNNSTAAPEGDVAVPELRDFHVQVDEQRAQQAAQRACRCKD